MLFESSMLLYPLRACQHCNKTLANSSCCPHSHSSFLNWGVGVYKTWVLIPNRVIRKRKEAKNWQQSVSSWQALYAWRKSYQIGLYILAASFHTLAYSPPERCLHPFLLLLVCMEWICCILCQKIWVKQKSDSWNWNLERRSFLAKGTPLLSDYSSGNEYLINNKL